MNNTTVRVRRAKATQAAIIKMHRLWHQVRNIEVCPTLKCEHPWAP